MKTLLFSSGPRAVPGFIGEPQANAFNLEDPQAFVAAIEKFSGTMQSRVEKIEAACAGIPKLENGIQDLSCALAAQRINGSNGAPGKRDFSDIAAYVRKGERQAGMQESSDPNGGYLLPETVDRAIQNQLINLSPLRNFATVQTLGAGAGSYSFVVNRRGITSGWVGETESRPETDTAVLGKITPTEGELYANPKISQWLLDDVAFDLGQWVQENISDEFAIQEGAAFVSGNAINKPRGFLTYTTTAAADAARDFGKLQYVKTAHATNFPTANPGDKLMDLLYALKPAYRAGPGVAWMMNSTTVSVVRKFKDGQGQYLWQQSMTAGEPSLLLGFPVGIDENMPDLGAGAFPVAFGNWRLGYRIVDRLGTRVLRDPFTNKPFVHFYATKRVAGSIADSNAIKLLKCEA